MPPETPFHKQLLLQCCRKDDHPWLYKSTALSVKPSAIQQELINNLFLKIVKGGNLQIYHGELRLLRRKE